MSERFKYRFEDGWDVYYDRKSFPSGMTCEIAFDTESRDRELFVFPSLVVFHKRSQAWNDWNESTGRDGIEPLLWAKSRLVDFENQMGYSWDKTTIYVSGSNGRRMRVYTKVLSKMGYTVCHDNGCRELKKVILRQTHQRVDNNPKAH